MGRFLFIAGNYRKVTPIQSIFLDSQKGSIPSEFGGRGEKCNLRRRMRSLSAIRRTSLQVDIFGFLPEENSRVYKDNRVTSSDGMNLSDVFSVSARVRALPGSQNTPLRFLCQT
jgi:hypothetical protein